MSFPTSVSTKSDLLEPVNRAITTLVSPVSSSDTTITVASTTLWTGSAGGILTIGLERIKYAGLTSNTFTGCTRGYDGSVAASHGVNAIVKGNVVAGYHNVLVDEIIAIETVLVDNQVSFLTEASIVASASTDSGGGCERKLSEATGTPSGTTTYFDISVDVPSGAKLLGCQLRVDTALTAGETWGAAYVTGSSTVLAAPGQAVAKNTKVNKMHVDEITTATTKIRITRDSGNFTNAVGVIRAVVYYETFVAMDSL